MDRRQKKSEVAIMSAFFELMKQKDLDKISISEIAKIADVNRGTIYLRYVDKYDLFYHFIEYQFGKLMEDCENFNHSMDAVSKEDVMEVFEYLEEKREVFQVILSDIGLPLFCNKMKNELIKKMTFHGTPLETKKGLKEVFISSAIVGVLEWWFKDNEVTAAELTDELWSLLNQLMGENSFNR